MRETAIIDTVAHAILLAELGPPLPDDPDGLDWDRISDHAKQHYRRMARAAINALKD